MLVADLRRKGRTRLDAQVLEGEAVHGGEPDLGLTFLGVQHHLSRDSIVSPSFSCDGGLFKSMKN